MGRSIGRSIVVLWGQQWLLLLVAVGLLWWYSPVSAYSALLAGIIFWLPSAYFTLRVFRFKGACATEEIVRNVYQGAMGKFLLTAVGFSTVFVFVKPLDMFTLFIVYIGLIISQCVLVSRWV